MPMADYFARHYTKQLVADRLYFKLDHWDTLFHVLDNAYATKYGHY